MPSIELLIHEIAALAAIRRAGPQGLAIGDGITVSSAIRLSLLGLVTIGRDQRLTANGAELRRAA